MFCIVNTRKKIIYKIISDILYEGTNHSSRLLLANLVPIPPYSTSKVAVERYEAPQLTKKPAKSLRGLHTSFAGVSVNRVRGYRDTDLLKTKQNIQS